MSNALNVKGHTSTANKGYLGNKSLPRAHGVIDPQIKVDAADARRSAAADERYGGPDHLKAKIAQCEDDAQAALMKKYGIPG